MMNGMQTDWGRQLIELQQTPYIYDPWKSIKFELSETIDTSNHPMIIMGYLNDGLTKD